MSIEKENENDSQRDFTFKIGYVVISFYLI